jgi:hypothetical protein
MPAGGVQGTDVAEFSATDVAFTGFRVVRENPVGLAIWAALQFVYALALDLFIAATAGGPFTALAHLQLQMTRQPQPDLSQAITLTRQLAPTMVVVFVSFLVLAAVLAAAMNRAVTHPEQRAFGFLRLASDELRQLGLLGLVVLLDLAIFWTVALVGSMLLMMASLAAGHVTTGAAVIFAQGAIVAAIAFFAIRLSLASPMTFATGRIALLTAWPLTRGRFWRLIGAYAITLALALVVLLLMNAIGLGALAALGGEAAIKSATDASLSSVQVVLTAPRLVGMAIDSIGWALIVPIVLCPPVAIYRALAGDGAARVFD